MVLKRIHRPSLKQRLLERKPQIVGRKIWNKMWEDEVRRKNWATNTQALHDTYASELLNPMPRAAYAVGVAHHRARLERILREAGVYVDPRLGLPTV